MNVRKARPSDVDDISRLYLRLNPGRRREGRLRHLHATANARVFLAEEGGRALGFIWVHLIDYANTSIAYIEELYVDPAHRRRGIGSALMEEALEWLASARTPVLFVSTTAGDRVAQRFYRATGFARTQGPWFDQVPGQRRRRRHPGKRGSPARRGNHA
jgi:ribosomal protein S18 acetylase RimI-like enzyme